MTTATFKDLCIDAADPVLLGEFWGRVLGLEVHRQDGGDTYLTGPTKEHTIWVNRVSEPKTAKRSGAMPLFSSSVEGHPARNSGCWRSSQCGMTWLDDSRFSCMRS